MATMRARITWKSTDARHAYIFGASCDVGERTVQKCACTPCFTPPCRAAGLRDGLQTLEVASTAPRSAGRPVERECGVRNGYIYGI